MNKKCYFNTVVEQTTEEKIEKTYELSQDKKYLRLKKECSIFDIVQEVNEKTRSRVRILSIKKSSSYVQEIEKYPLREVDNEKIAKLRKTDIPSIVIKLGDKLYHARIPRNATLIGNTFLGKHQCANSQSECTHLSAAPDEEGGCAKVRNCSIGIENYPWIRKGFETFNTRHNAFVVAKCAHYEKYVQEKVLTSEQINAARLRLAQYVYPEVETIQEARLKKRTK